jgi:undecaprenyl-phosphate 4-deoxy-4-formamido-L-arabinose transferase
MVCKLEKKSISIVIPVYNSEKCLENLVLRINKVFNFLKRNFEIIFVNDNSNDKSWEIIKHLKYTYQNITAISLTKNYGEHNAVMAGLNYVKGDYIIIMDDDGQNPPEELYKLIDEADKFDNDVIYTYYDETKQNFFRIAGSKFANYCAGLVINKPNKLYLSSFKLIKKVIVEKIITSKSPFVYIDGLIFQFTDKIFTVKVKHLERKIGSSNYNLKKLLSLWTNIIFNHSLLPLRLSFIIGIIILIIVFFFSIITIIEKIFFSSDIPLGYASMILLISLVSGFQFIIIGLLGEYIGRMFLRINNKPQYSIRERI